MRTRSLFSRCSLLAAFAGLGAVVSLTGSARGADAFTLVVHKDNAQTSVSVAELKSLMSGGKKQWASGAVVHVGVIMSEAPETQYLAGLLGGSVPDMLARIQQQVFKGEMRRPAVLKSGADCVAFARADAGALCVASSAGLPADVHALSVK
jgi:hypothetical protein